MLMVSYVDDLVVPEPDSIEVDAHLLLLDDHLSGELRLPDGRRIAFDGWLGLVGAVELVRDVRPDGRGDLGMGA